jgi:hypothetical protein
MDLEADRQEKAAAKARAERKKTANIQRVAELESAAKRKTREMEHQANDPVDTTSSQPRVKRTRNLPEMVNLNKGTTTIMVDHLLTTRTRRLGRCLER